MTDLQADVRLIDQCGRIGKIFVIAHLKAMIILISKIHRKDLDHVVEFQSCFENFPGK